MDIIQALTSQQRHLVESHLSVVDWVILDYIKSNESVVGLSREDLQQEGYVWLCHAAATYDGISAAFGTYARRVVRNGLISHCRKICRQPQPLSLDQPQDADGFRAGNQIEPRVRDGTEELIDRADAATLLHRLKGKYAGTTKLGIEALEWKIRGLTGSEIAALYGVPSNHVSAWIARAAQKLRSDEQVLAYRETFSR